MQLNDSEGTIYDSKTPDIGRSLKGYILACCRLRMGTVGSSFFLFLFLAGGGAGT